jgi:CRISPR-associated protein Csx14
MPEHPHVLVASLGGQPQIVTFTLDLLLARGFLISEVVVVHPKAPVESRLYRSLLRLNAEFNSGKYNGSGHTIRFHSQMLELEGQPLEDIREDADADGALDTIHGLLSDLKRRNYRIHLSVTGGRRLIALLATSVAALNFDRHDNIWHIYTPAELVEQVRDGQQMHVPPDAGVKLIQSPFLTLGAYVASSTQPFRRSYDEQRARLDAQNRSRCAAVDKEATNAQRAVLRAFANGLRPQQVANELFISQKTVNSHKTVLLALCKNAWEIDQGDRLDFHFLWEKFWGYFGEEA